MKTLFRATLPLLCLIAVGCSSSTEPGDSGDPGQDDFTILAEASIGPAGGLLEAEGFALNVPAGAFSAAHDLVLAVNPDSTPMGEQGVSPLYRITGLPDRPRSRASMRSSAGLSNGRAIRPSG